jgi:hypothetical protein
MPRPTTRRRYQREHPSLQGRPTVTGLAEVLEAVTVTNRSATGRRSPAESVLAMAGSLRLRV